MESAERMDVESGKRCKERKMGNLTDVSHKMKSFRRHGNKYENAIRDPGWRIRLWRNIENIKISGPGSGFSVGNISNLRAKVKNIRILFGF